jgi:DNA-binding MurR/RpiR family transcriptional regulator
MSSRIAQLSIIDTLYAGLALGDYDRSLRRIQRTREAAATKRY